MHESLYREQSLYSPVTRAQPTGDEGTCSVCSKALAQRKAALDSSPRVVAQAQRKQALQRRATAPRNATGLPDRLKLGIEQLSGVAIDDVRVHRNSGAPAQLAAHAHTQGNQIYLGPGQEQHLAHEAWHVVQQKQGRVRATSQLDGGIPLNDEPALEREADVMGRLAAQASPQASREELDATPSDGATLQRVASAHAAAPVQRQGWLSAIGSGLWSAGSSLLGMAQAHPYITAMLAGGAGVASYLLASNYRSRSRPRRPRPGQVGIEDMRPDQLWRMYINPMDFDEAEHSGDPASLYDNQQSPGFRASMTAAIDQELRFDGGNLGRRVDYAEYRRIHDLVTAHIPEGGLGTMGSRNTMRGPSAGQWTYRGTDGVFYTDQSPPPVDMDSIPYPPVTFPINDWQKPAPPTPLAADLLGEQLGDRAMVGPDGVVRNNGNTIEVNYGVDEGPVLIQQILDRYYDEVGAAEGQAGKLRAIVKAIRALHVTHGFRDANGRLNVNIMLNKFLLEQGFDPSIMPEQGLGVFGGAFDIDTLVGMVGEGMGRFRGYTNQ